MGSLTMARFIAERAYDLFLAPAPGSVCACLAGIAVWTSTPLDTPGPVVPRSAARRSADTASRMQDQRLRADPRKAASPPPACKKRMAYVSRSIDGQMGVLVNPARWLSRLKKG
jgi:hypothetical protein